MFGRSHLVLAALLGAQLVLLLLVRGPFAVRSGAAESHALLPVLESITPARIELEGQDGARLVLERKEDRWTLPDRGGYPVDGDKVKKLVDDLAGIRVRRPVVTSSRYHEALEVAEDKHARRVRIWSDPGGDPAVDLLIGSSPKYRFVHVRRAGEDPVYEAMGLSPYDIRAERSAWIERKLADVPFDDIHRVELENEHGRIVLERGEDGWRLAEPAPKKKQGKLDQGKTDSFVRSLASLWIAEPVGPVDEEAHGFAKPAARYTLVYGKDDGEEGETVTVLVGAKAEGSAARRYATREGFGFTAEVAESSVSKALNEKPADLR